MCARPAARPLALLLLFPLAGCSALTLAPGESSPAATDARSREEIAYYKVIEAAQQNSIVLQVAGDSEPVRMLPLPASGEPVFVSQLIEQTGLAKQFGGMRITVLRGDPRPMNSTSMEVRYRPGKGVDPATDYALAAGDRITVSPSDEGMWGGPLDGLLPSLGG